MQACILLFLGGFECVKLLVFFVFFFFFVGLGTYFCYKLCNTVTSLYVRRHKRMSYWGGVRTGRRTCPTCTRRHDDGSTASPAGRGLVALENGSNGCEKGGLLPGATRRPSAITAVANVSPQGVFLVRLWDGARV